MLSTLRDAEERVRRLIDDMDSEREEYSTCQDIEITDKKTGIKFLFCGRRRAGNHRMVHIALAPVGEITYKFKPKPNLGTFI